MNHRPAPVLIALCLATAASAAPVVEYPAGYRQWTHVKSMVIYSDKNPLFGQFGGIHHVYANPEATKALVKGGTFPDGSVLVFDLLALQDDPGAYAEGQRKLLAVMQMDRKRFASTGGWGFEAFKGDSRTERIVTDPTGQCFGCHQTQQKNEFVYSGYRP